MDCNDTKAGACGIALSWGILKVGGCGTADGTDGTVGPIIGPDGTGGAIIDAGIRANASDCICNAAATDF